MTEFGNGEIISGIMVALRKIFGKSFSAEDYRSLAVQGLERAYFRMHDLHANIRNPISYAVKTAANLGHDELRVRTGASVRLEDPNSVQDRTLRPSILDEVIAAGAPPPGGWEREMKVDIAFQVALRLVDSLGQDRVVNVMRFILETLKRGWDEQREIEYITNEEIAEALGYEVGKVRYLKERGWRRLRARAAAEGLFIGVLDQSDAAVLTARGGEDED